MSSLLNSSPRTLVEEASSPETMQDFISKGITAHTLFIEAYKASETTIKPSVSLDSLQIKASRLI